MFIVFRTRNYLIINTMKNSQKSLFQHTDSQRFNKGSAEIVLAKKFGNKGYLPITLQ